MLHFLHCSKRDVKSWKSLILDTIHYYLLHVPFAKIERIIEKNMTFLYRIHRKKHFVVDQSRDESIPNVQEKLEKKPIEMEDKIGRQQVLENIGRSAYLVVNNTTLHFHFLSDYWLMKIWKKIGKRRRQFAISVKKKSFYLQNYTFLSLSFSLFKIIYFY